MLKLALTRELGENARLVYIIKMENTFGNLKPFTEKIPSQYKGNIPSQKVDLPISGLSTQLRNPFVIPGIKNLKIESQMSSDLDHEFSPNSPPRDHSCNLGPNGARKEPKGAKRLPNDTKRNQKRAKRIPKSCVNL